MSVFIELVKSLFGDEDDDGSKGAPSHAPNGDSAVMVELDDLESQTIVNGESAHYPTREEAEAELVRAAMEYIHHHSGKMPPDSLRDLYVNMLRDPGFFAAAGSAVGSSIYWIPSDHPIAVVLHNHFTVSKNSDVAEGRAGPGKFGSVVIYNEAYVDFCVQQVGKIFAARGIVLDGVEDEEEEEEVAEQQEAPVAQSTPPPTVRMTPSGEEGSKKHK